MQITFTTYKRRNVLQLALAVLVLMSGHAHAQAAKKQTFTSGKGNKVEVEATSNLAKVYEESGELYLIPGQAYQFKLTGIPSQGWSVDGQNPVTLTVTVPDTNPPATKDTKEIGFKKGEMVDKLNPSLKVVIPKFKVLDITSVKRAYLWPYPGGKAFLGNATSHLGEVTVKPAAARAEFDVKLEQFVTSESKKNGVLIVVANNPLNGRDVAYAGLVQTVTNPPADVIRITCADEPGYGNTAAWWNAEYNTGNTITFDFKANLYIQTSPKGKDKWTTAGKGTWSCNPVLKPGNPSGHGPASPDVKGDKISGAASNEAPTAP